jgi:endonuclease YncB( thermonuclease family)
MVDAFEYRLALPPDLRRDALQPPPVPAPPRMNGKIIGHYDGDSVYVEMDFQLYNLFARKQLIRAKGIAARELNLPGGKEAREALKVRLGMTVGSPVVMTGLKPDKYGNRLDAVITCLGQHGVPYDLGSALIADHWAVPWDGTGPQPLPPWPRPEDTLTP